MPIKNVAVSPGPLSSARYGSCCGLTDAVGLATFLGVHRIAGDFCDRVANNKKHATAPSMRWGN